MGEDCGCTHLTDKETEALGGEVICPWSCSQAVAQPTLLKPESSALGVSLDSVFILFSKSFIETSFTYQATPHVFIYLAALGLHCLLSLVVVSGGYSSLQSTDSKHAGFSSCGSWTLERRVSSVAHELSCPVARGIFPDQGPNLCPLH